MESSKLFTLMSWLSPSFPVGAYSYSHGLEFAVEAELVRNRETLEDWVEAILSYGTGRNDAIFFCAAYRSSGVELEHIAELASVMRGTLELAGESRGQGQAFLNTVRSVWPSEQLSIWISELGSKGISPSYSVAVAVVCALNQIPLEMALTAYLQSFAASLISAGVRLIPLGQTDGQLTLAKMNDVAASTVNEAVNCSLDDLGSATSMVDWASMRHENQYARLFRS